MDVLRMASGCEKVRPAGHWRTLTLLGAITLDGLLAIMTIESPTDGDVFLAYLEQVLCPRLRARTESWSWTTSRHTRIRRCGR